MKHDPINNTILAEERTLLASERTYSAWIRTALAAMAGGIAILRLISFKTDMHRIVAHILGEILILWGCLVIVFASIDYKRIHKKLIVAQSFKTSTVGFLIIVLPLLVISSLIVWVTLP